MEEQFEEFRSVLSDSESLSFLLHSTEEDGKIIYVSDSLLSYLGYSCSQLKGKSISILRNREENSEMIESAIRCGHEIVTEVVNKSFDGSSHRTKVFMSLASSISGQINLKKITGSFGSGRG